MSRIRDASTPSLGGIVFFDKTQKGDKSRKGAELTLWEQDSDGFIESKSRNAQMHVPALLGFQQTLFMQAPPAGF
jgi:hypothetical protein